MKYTYKEDGTIASFAPTADGVPEKVQKQLIIDMEKEYRACGSTGRSITLRQHRIV